MNEELKLTLEDHNRAKQEIAFLLNMLSQAIEDIVGRSSGVVGRMAGGAAARKMPLFFESNDIQPIIQGIKSYLQGGFDISDIITGEDIELSFGRCPLREVCETENIPVGDSLCMLFHNYMNGMIMKLTEKDFKMSILESGDTACIIKHSAKTSDRKII